MAQDESWREPINLQAKILKHQSFEAEILANRNSVETLTKVMANENNMFFKENFKANCRILKWLQYLYHGDYV